MDIMEICNVKEAINKPWTSKAGTVFYHFITNDDNVSVKEALTQLFSLGQKYDRYPPILKKCWLSSTVAVQMINILSSSSDEELPLELILELPSWVDMTWQDVDGPINYVEAINNLFIKRCKNCKAFDEILGLIKIEDQSSCKYDSITAWSWKAHLVKIVERERDVEQPNITTNKDSFSVASEQVTENQVSEAQEVKILTFKGNCKTTQGFLKNNAFVDHVERTKAICLHELRKTFPQDENLETTSNVIDRIFFSVPLSNNKDETDDIRLLRMTQYLQRTLSDKVQQFIQDNLIEIAKATSLALQKSMHYLEFLQKPGDMGYGSIEGKSRLNHFENGLVIASDNCKMKIVEKNLEIVSTSFYWLMRKQLQLSHHLILAEEGYILNIVRDMLNGRPKKYGIQLEEHTVHCIEGNIIMRIIDRKSKIIRHVSEGQMKSVSINDIKVQFGYMSNDTVAFSFKDSEWTILQDEQMLKDICDLHMKSVVQSNEIGTVEIMRLPPGLTVS